MGEMTTFPSNGHTCDGYLAGDGTGPGVIVIQEWWGLVPHIKDVADRFAAAGFTALAPDLYHGESSTEPDGAGKLMMALNLEQAAKDLSGAVALLQQKTGRDQVGVVGYCMGGGLALVLATQRPDARPHRDAALYDQLFHPVAFEPGTRLAQLYAGQRGAIVNSVHHQGIKDLAPDFVVEARCPDDGTIEAVRWTGQAAYVAAVQWHPEFHAGLAEPASLIDDAPLLADFRAACIAARAPSN